MSMRINLRSSLAVAVIWALCGLSAVMAADWPSGPVHLIVPFPPGGSNDVIARRLAEQLTKSLGQSVIVENKAGGAGTIGSQAVASAAPDGKTFLFISNSIATSAAVQQTPYNAVTAFTAITPVAQAPFVIITRTGFPARTVPELVEIAKRNPGSLNYGSAGLGDTTQMTTELFGDIVGVRMTGVNYKGISPAQLDLVAGRLDLMITTMASIRGTAADQLPKLAFTSAKRDPDYPDVPTVLEQGIDYVVDVWWGVFAPAGLAPAIRDRMNREIAAIVATPDFAQFLKNFGASPVSSSPAEFQAVLASDVERWKHIAQRAGLHMQ